VHKIDKKIGPGLGNLLKGLFKNLKNEVLLLPETSYGLNP
jgi:hypothetical protein